MKLDPTVVAELTRPMHPTSYVRIIRSAFRATPLGIGYGETRFSSPVRAFKVLYIARDMKTAIAEAVIRDRFEGSVARAMMLAEMLPWSVASISAVSPLLLLDLRGAGCHLLGVSTDITGAKAHDESRVLSQAVHDQTSVDGILYHSRLTGVNCVAIYERAVRRKLIAARVMDLIGSRNFVSVLRALRVNLIR